MAARMKDYSSNWTCALCLNGFNDPKILECFHSFCKNCLEDHIAREKREEEFNCPTCKKEIKIPEAGVESFTTNVYVADIEYHKESADHIECSDKKAECAVCDKGSDPEYSCSDCQQLLCGACKKTHDLLPSCGKHEVSHLNEGGLWLYNTAVCPQHNKAFAEFCHDCHLVICGRCTSPKHGGHYITNLGEVDDIAEEARKELKIIQEEMEKRRALLKDVTTAIQKESFKLNSETAEACNQVDKQIEEAHAEMKQRGERIKLDIRNGSGAENHLLNEVKDDVTDLIHKVDLYHGKLTKHITEGDSLELLTALPTFKRRQETISRKQYAVPDIQFPTLKKAPASNTPVIGEIHKYKRNTIQHNFDIQQLAKYHELESPVFILFENRMKISVRQVEGKGESEESYVNVKLHGTDINGISKSLLEIINKHDKSETITSIPDNGKSSNKRLEPQIAQTPSSRFGSSSRQRSEPVRIQVSSNTNNEGSRKSILWSDVMTIQDLTNVENGFINKNNTFTARVTLEKASRTSLDDSESE